MTERKPCKRVLHYSSGESVVIELSGIDPGCEIKVRAKRSHGRGRRRHLIVEVPDNVMIRLDRTAEIASN